MNLSDLHRRLLQDVLETGNALPFVITGGYAVQAHGLVDRLSKDIDVATDSSMPMDALANLLSSGLTDRGWRVRIIGTAPLSARFMVTDPELDDAECEVGILRENFSRSPEDTPYGPVLALDDVIGTKVRALAERAAARDLIDVHSASRWRSTAELENLGRRHAWDSFSLEGLALRLDGCLWRDDEEFFAYGLAEEDLVELRRWAQAWADDIRLRLASETFVGDDDDLP
ncbi:MAG: nucleotidyl transferase AbiEii/AbiGii toxin family protein [Nocardiopsaceae bacterium]|nr:nucleotidyl transferase AbiEii/AbiGii toxin family protein [Nocardiopsaceae bacterium]